MKNTKNKKSTKESAKASDSYVLNTAGAVMPDPAAKFRGDSIQEMRSTFAKGEKSKVNVKKSAR